MRDNIENEAGLERLGRAIVILVVAGAVGVVVVSVWGWPAPWAWWACPSGGCTPCGAP